VLNSVRLPNSAGKMEALLLSSCWVQDRARSNSVSSDLKMLLAYRVEEDGGTATELLLGPGQGEVQSCDIGQ
jgi:hypothetical protein